MFSKQRITDEIIIIHFHHRPGIAIKERIHSCEGQGLLRLSRAFSATFMDGYGEDGRYCTDPAFALSVI
jgi:hypothetical protein